MVVYASKEIIYDQEMTTGACHLQEIYNVPHPLLNFNII